MVFGTHCMKPHSSLSVTTPYVRISEAIQVGQVVEPRGQKNIVSLTKLPPSRLGVGLQQFIDDGVEIHQPGVFSKIVLGFTEEHVRLSVRPANRDLARFRKRTHDFDVVRKLYVHKAGGQSARTFSFTTLLCRRKRVTLTLERGCCARKRYVR